MTDAWLTEAPDLPPAKAALTDVTLLAAPTPRAEAAAIALRLREAAETGQRATLVTPDRMLARTVTAALDRWGILPDDSAGIPLDMTNSGRLLALVADLMAGRGDAIEMLAVLKHPLTHSGAAHDQHRRWVTSLELNVLRGGGLHPDRRALDHWVTEHGGDADWAAWVAESVLGARATAAPLSDLVAQHIAQAEALAAGAGQDGAGALWDGEDGQTARDRMRAVAAEAAHGGVLQPRDYRDLITAILADTDLAQSRSAACRGDDLGRARSPGAGRRSDDPRWPQRRHLARRRCRRSLAQPRAPGAGRAAPARSAHRPLGA